MRTHLGDYLAPLLHWTKEDVNREGSAYWSTNPRGWWGEPEACPPMPPALADILARRKLGIASKEPSFPLEINPEDANSPNLVGALNLHLAYPPTDEQTARIAEAVSLWQWHGYGPGKMGEPHVVGSILRWPIGDDRMYPDVGLRILREWLATLEDVPIVRLVGGTETIG